MGTLQTQAVAHSTCFYSIGTDTCINSLSSETTHARGKCPSGPNRLGDSLLLALVCKGYTCKMEYQGPKGKGPGFWLSLVLGPSPSPLIVPVAISSSHAASASLPHIPHALVQAQQDLLSRATEDNKVPRLLASLEACPLLLGKVRSWGWGSRLP